MLRLAAMSSIGRSSCSKRSRRKFSAPSSSRPRFWTKAINLSLKVCYLLFKVRVLRFQRSNLLRKQRNLLLQKINYVLTKGGGCGQSSDFFRSIERTHNQEIDQTADGSSKPITSSRVS